jgi:toxin ParE1/3/4
VYKRAAARRDLIGHYVYLYESGGQDLADRFLNQIEETFIDLTLQREMGTPLTPRHPALIGIRKWRVKGFQNFLIFYIPRSEGVSIVRVLYAAQDWWNMIGLMDEPTKTQ